MAAAPALAASSHHSRPAGTKGKHSTAFVSGVLPPPPPGSTATYNIAAEPQIRADGAGSFYITAENGLGAGTDAWKSSNGGLSYSSLTQPNEGSTTTGGTTGLAPGGGDTDVATATVKNNSGQVTPSAVHVGGFARAG